MKKIMMFLMTLVSLAQAADAQAWREAPYYEPRGAYASGYGGYRGGSCGSYVQPPPRCGGQSGTTVVVVQPQCVERAAYYVDPYYTQQYNNRYYAQPYGTMGQQVWNMSPVYDPYYNAGYDPYYSGTSMSAGRQAAIIGLQAADMIGSEFIKLAINDILYRP